MSLYSSIFCDTCGAANRVQAIYCSVCGRPLHTPSGTGGNTKTGLLGNQHVLRQRYRITGQIGQGGFGAVYRAEDIDFDHRPVAVKEMSQSSLSPHELVEATNAFKREALILACLTHPNLPRIYEQFTDTGRRYLVMDFIEGETLEEYLKNVWAGHTQGTQHAWFMLPIEKILDIGIQLCSVLDYLHTRQPPIVFRDLKPANIMLSPNGHLYLIDFGIARHFKPGQTKDTNALGSSGYAAPEQYGRAQSTPRSDIYGLGAVLHELLTGNDPSDSPFQFAPLQLGSHPALSALGTLVMQMLEMDASKRPANAAIVKQELQRIAAQLPSSQTHPLQSNIPQAYQPPVMPKLPLAPPPQSNLLFVCRGHTSRVTAVAWSPDGRRIATASYDKKVRIWNATTGSAMLTYRGHAGRVNALAWSSDSKHIVSASNDKTVQVWDSTTGKPIHTYQGHAAPINAVAWSSDNKRIATASDDRTVQVWDMTPGSRVFTHKGHGAAVSALAWSPDSKRIVSGSVDRTVQVWDSAKEMNILTSFLFPNRGHSTYHGHVGRVNAVTWSRDGKCIASVSNDKTMHVWDTANGKVIFLYRNPSFGINAVAWSPDSRYLAFGGNDKVIQVLDVVTRNIVFTYPGHTGYITSLTWSPDGRLIASSGVDRTIQVWQVR